MWISSFLAPSTRTTETLSFPTPEPLPRTKTGIFWTATDGSERTVSSVVTTGKVGRKGWCHRLSAQAPRYVLLYCVYVPSTRLLLVGIFAWIALFNDGPSPNLPPGSSFMLCISFTFCFLTTLPGHLFLSIEYCGGYGDAFFLAGSFERAVTASTGT